MAPPSQLAIATSSINRLLKEESLYRAELKSQERQLEKLKGDGSVPAVNHQEAGEAEKGNGNEEFLIRQGEQAIQETKAVFGPLREKITGMVEKVEGLLSSDRSKAFPAMEVEAAKDAVARAKEI
ncbi:tubulin folding cofactor A [Lecanora helva]